MWEWFKRSCSTVMRSPQKPSEREVLLAENQALRALLGSGLAMSQELNATLAASLDRVIAAKFDRPTVLTPASYEQPKRSMEMPLEHLADVMTVEDDREFLERLHG